MKRIWVVEMLNDVYRIPRWEPTIGVRLTQKDARDECRDWQRRNPPDKFRVRAYVNGRSFSAPREETPR